MLFLSSTMLVVKHPNFKMENQKLKKMTTKNFERRLKNV